MNGCLLEDFGTPTRARPMGPVPEAQAGQDRFDDGYNAGWDDAMAQAEADGVRISGRLAERLDDLHQGQRAAMAAALRMLEPALRDIFDRLLPRAAERAFLPLLMEEVRRVLDGGIQCVGIAVSPEDASALTRLLERSGIPAGKALVRAEPAMSLSQAVIHWEGQERRVDLEGTLAALDDALETFLATMDRGDDAADAALKEAING